MQIYLRLIAINNISQGKYKVCKIAEISHNTKSSSFNLLKKCTVKGEKILLLFIYKKKDDLTQMFKEY